MIPLTPWLIFYLVLFLLGLAVELILTTANVRHLRTHGHRVPAPFVGYIDEDRLASITDYTIDTERFDVLTSCVGGLCFLVVILYGLLPALQNWLEGLHWGVVGSGLLFLGVLAAIQVLFSIPFDYYKTFIIEQR